MKIELLLALALTLVANGSAQQGITPSLESWDTAVSDTTPPSIVSFDFEPKVVDTTKSDQTITITTQIKDDLSGLFLSGLFSGSNGPTMVWFTSPSGDQSASANFGEYNLVSGNMLNGTYVYNMTLPKHSESGKWHLSFFLLYDTVRNSLRVNETQMKNLGFPTEIEVKSRKWFDLFFIVQI